MARSSLHSRGSELRASQAHIVEVFSSIQGEGPHVGRRHIFLRFFACNLRCNYCDTPESLTGHPEPRIEQSPGAGDFSTAQNPMTVDQIAAAVEKLNVQPHHAVALTGGEPLLQSPLLGALAPRIHDLGLLTYLETNGTLARNLAEVIDQMDIIAMDLKLPDTLSTGRDYIAEHREFVSVAIQKELFVKLVLPSAPPLDWIDQAAGSVGSVSPDIPFIIQPITPRHGSPSAPSHADILDALRVASRHLTDVRVIPQTHCQLGLR